MYYNYNSKQEDFQLQYDSTRIDTAPHIVLFVVGVILTLLLLFFKVNTMYKIRGFFALLFWIIYIAVTVRLMP